MAERRRIIEGTWDCSSCGSKGVLGRHKACPQCGNPREKGSETEFDFGPTTESGASTKEAVIDPGLLKLAEAGADWRCPFCGGSNGADVSACRACSAVRPEAAEEPPAPPHITPLAALAATATPATPAPAVPFWSPGRTRLARGCGCGCPVVLVLGFFLLTLLGYWGTRTHECRGRVVGRSWSRVIHRETFTQVTKEGWRDELKAIAPVMPVSGKGEVAGVSGVRDCRQQQRGTRSVADGTETVCHDVTRRKACGTHEKCRRRDKGNGFAEEVCEDVTDYCNKTERECGRETRYRQEPVYASQCRYDTWEWRDAGTQRASGSDEAPRWPDVAASERDRLRREETYEVRAEYVTKGATKAHVLHPKDEQELALYTAGQELVLTVNNFGDVDAVRRRE